MSKAVITGSAANKHLKEVIRVITGVDVDTVNVNTEQQQPLLNLAGTAGGRFLIASAKIVLSCFKQTPLKMTYYSDVNGEVSVSLETLPKALTEGTLASIIDLKQTTLSPDMLDEIPEELLTQLKESKPTPNDKGCYLAFDWTAQGSNRLKLFIPSGITDIGYIKLPIVRFDGYVSYDNDINAITNRIDGLNTDCNILDIRCVELNDAISQSENKLNETIEQTRQEFTNSHDALLQRIVLSENEIAKLRQELGQAIEQTKQEILEEIQGAQE